MCKREDEVKREPGVVLFSNSPFYMCTSGVYRVSSRSGMFTPL